MTYRSTRGGEERRTFEHVLLSGGYSSDGGLYMPEVIPVLSSQQLEDMSSFSYPQIVHKLFEMFIDPSEVPPQVIPGLLQEAFKSFPTAEVMHVTEVSENLHVAELFHGPTLAFKDLALSSVGQLLRYFISKNKKHLTILVATSGDTGSSAIESVRGVAEMDIIVLYPRGRCTVTQELQMTTVLDQNVHCIAVDGGSSDDIDVHLKRCLTDRDLSVRYGLVSINSINWARILVQIAHYFYIYFRSRDKLGQPVHVVCPTGAGGNVTAGCIANRMGLPIRLVIAQNINNALARVAKEGAMTVGVSTKTIAPAMDIQDPYNVERLLYLFSDYNTRVVGDLMQDLATHGTIQVPSNIMEKLREVIVDSCVVDDTAIQATIRRCWSESSYPLCPHTAVAVTYHYRSSATGASKQHVCVATASLAKFPEVAELVDIPRIPHPRIDNLTSLPTRYRQVPSPADCYTAVLETIKDIDTRVQKH